MRYTLFICCLVGVTSLGCSKAPGNRATRSVPAGTHEESEALAPPQDEAVLHHGLARRADFGTGPEVRLGAITLTAPPNWKRTKPGSSYYLAEFALPHAENDTTDGRVTVSFGSGSMDANIDVFAGEFESVSQDPKQETKDIAGLQVTFVDIAGAYTNQHAQSAPAVPLPGYRMILAVIPVGGQLCFVKAVGPQQTIAANVEGIDTFVRSVQWRDSNPESAKATPENGSVVHLAPLTFTAPPTWRRTQPRSSFVQAEFALPQAGKDTADARLTVSVVSGTVKDNVDRWRGQFVGAIDSPKEEGIEIGGLKATFVDFTGTFADQAGMMAPAVNRPDYRMIAAIIPIHDKLYVIKAVGPQLTIAAHVEAIDAFLQSLRENG